MTSTRMMMMKKKKIKKKKKTWTSAAAKERVKKCPSRIKRRGCTPWKFSPEKGVRPNTLRSG